MTFNSLNIPKEILKFRLDKQLSRLKQLLTESRDNFEEEDKYQLYQRILSWFIMGRLAKSEYDGMLAGLLITNELTELHNKVIELLRAIYCDSMCPFSDNFDGTSNFKNSFLDSFSFELNLLPAEELEDLEAAVESDEEESKQMVLDIKETSEEQREEDNLMNLITTSAIKTKSESFSTFIDNLSPSEEALISEALRNPIHDIASMERDSMLKTKNFDIITERFCTEISALPDQNLMKQRFLRVGSHFNDNPSLPDSVSVLACKSLEDYMKNLLENVATLKFGHEMRLRPPISYIFPDEITTQNDELETGCSEAEAVECSAVSKKDLSLLFKLKPWLLGDMESDLIDLM